MLSGQLNHQQQTAALVADEAGLAGVEAWSVEAACASGGAAAVAAFRALRGGDLDVALVVGLERMAHVPVDAATRGLATASDWDTEGARGETFVSLNARIMRRYIEVHGVDSDAFAPFSILAHHNALTAEHACFHRAVSAEAYRTSRVLDAPLRLLDASPICDGAAALLVVAECARTEPLLRAAAGVARVAGFALTTDTTALHRRTEPLALAACASSARRALRAAACQHTDIDLFEVHDAYTSMAAAALEATGFSPPGRAPAEAAAGRFARDGALPIATFGGLKGRGHPVGATGVYQLAEAYLQVTGQAGTNQVDGARTALTQNVGGVGTTVASVVLQRA